jgi:glucokinase
MDVLLDVGGTGIKAALCDGTGHITPAKVYPSRAGEGKEALLCHFSNIIRETRDAAPGGALGAVRMAFPGPFDYARGAPLLNGLAKYEALYGVTLPDALDAPPGTGWMFLNDVDAFALGAIEKFGLGGRVVFLCLGTGAGSAFSVGGKISADESEGIPPGGWVYPLPFLDGRIDDFLSVRGLAKLGGGLSPLELSGRPEGLAVYVEFGGRLRDAMAPVVARFRPDAFVLGGGISKSAALFQEPLATLLKGFRAELIVAEDTSALIFKGLAGRNLNGH